MKLKTLRTTLIATILLALSFAAKASEHCSVWADIAENVMESRQNNITQEQMLHILSETTSIPEEAKGGVVSIITAAYSNPIQPYIQDKLSMIKQFGDAIFIQCLKDTAMEA